MIARGTDGHPPAWLRPTAGERRWAVGGAFALLIALQWTLPADFAIHPRWLAPSIEAVVLVILGSMHPERLSRRSPALRRVSLFLLGLITISVAISLVLLVRGIVTGHGINASALLMGGGAVWLANVIVFAMIYWEYDRGGPADRANAISATPDLLFPQMSDDELAKDWEPRFFDYLFVSFTCSTAYSPTDTMPLTRWCKALFTTQSVLSLITITLVTARAVNILPGN